MRIKALLAALLLVTGARAQNEFGTGLVFDDDAYDKIPEKPTLLTRDYTVLPAAHSLRRYCPTPGNQGQYGTCTSWATSYAARTIAEAIRYGWNNQLTINSQAFSPIFVYKQIKLTDEPGCENGTCIDDALDLLEEKGAPKYKDFDVLCADYIPTALFAKAKPYVIDDYFRLFDVGASYDTKIRTVKKALSQDRPVIIGMNVPNSFYNCKDVWTKTETNNNGGGHAMCVVAYDDNKYGGAFLIMNSWGTRWGNNGFTWVRYHDFANNTKYAFEMYVAKKQAPQPQPVVPKPQPQPQPKPQPVVVKNKFTGSLRFQLSTGETMSAALQSGIYRMKSAYISGTRYRLYLTNNEPAYVYIIGSDQTNKVSRVFPPADNISPALVYSANNIAIPSEQWFIEMDDTKGTDHICVLYSSKALNIKQLMEQIENGTGTFSAKVRRALGTTAAATADISFSTSTIGFKAETTGTVVPIFVEMTHN